MSTLSPRGMLGRLRRNEDGLGIITVVFLAAVLTALTITAVKVTVGNMDNTRRDRQALGALATSEAGVTQALMRLRTGALSSLTCMEPAPGAPLGTDCTGAGPSWTSATNPQQVRVDGTTGACTTGNDCFKVWISTVKPYMANCPERRDPTKGNCSGTYRVHSTGLADSGPAARAVTVDVDVTPYPFPMGIFAEDFSGKGNVGLHRESVFTSGDIVNRNRDDHQGSGFQFDWDASAGRPVLDLFSGQPSAAHATGVISDGNEPTRQGQSGPIHTPGKPCNPLYPFDQSGSGAGLTAGDGCYGEFSENGQTYPTTSYFGPEDLQAVGYRTGGLTNSQYDALRSLAKLQGTYNIDPASVSSRLQSLNNQGITSPVLFWDNTDVSLSDNNFPTTFKRDLDASPSCANTTNTNNVTIVVAGENSDLTYQSGNNGPHVVASVFVPKGELRGNGGYNILGTVFAQSIALSGNPDYFMDECFAANPPGGVRDVHQRTWREADSKDVN